MSTPIPVRPSAGSLALYPVFELDLHQPIRQCRAVPVQLSRGERAFLAVYSADFDVDPYTEMFFFPTDRLHLVLFTAAGEVLWKKDLSRGVVPGMWFCPVLPFDLDGDGTDEIYFVNNIDENHPLAHSSYRLQRLDARTGEETGQWVWPAHGRSGSLSHAFRNFLIAGFAGDKPVLVAAQGTYGDIHFQAYDAGMTERWTHDIAAAAAGARGSHMTTVVDIDEDGNDELIWGERVIDIGTGVEQFCADRDSYRGHSDAVIPVLDDATDNWFIYTNRESDPAATPRVCLYDAHGRRIWGQVDQGHIDMGWVARWDDGKRLAMAIRIGHKTCGPDGRFHTGMNEFSFDAFSGEPHPMPFALYQTMPVDLNGDGMHELVRGIPGGDGAVLDRAGNTVGNVGGTVAIGAKLLPIPGEQLLVYSEDGMIRLWADRNAVDNAAALRRYTNRAYATNLRLMSTGWNQMALCGI